MGIFWNWRRFHFYPGVWRAHIRWYVIRKHWHFRCTHTGIHHKNHSFSNKNFLYLCWEKCQTRIFDNYLWKRFGKVVNFKIWLRIKTILRFTKHFGKSREFDNRNFTIQKQSIFIYMWNGQQSKLMAKSWIRKVFTTGRLEKYSSVWNHKYLNNWWQTLYCRWWLFNQRMENKHLIPIKIFYSFKNINNPKIWIIKSLKEYKDECNFIFTGWFWVFETY